MRTYFIKTTVIIALALNISAAFAQDESFNAITSQREEIQRYIGYEILPLRYLSLPYDITLNNNERAIFLDIGLLYFCFFPLLLLLTFYGRNKFAFWLAGLSALFVHLFGSTNSFVFSRINGEIKSDRESLSEYLLGEVPFLNEPVSHFSAYLYYLYSFIADPFEKVLGTVSGNSDYITYPLLVILFSLSCLMLVPILKKTTKERKLLVIIFWCFLFFWIKYSAGIVWYGFPVLVLGILILIILINRTNPHLPKSSVFLKYSFISIASFWVLSAFLLRAGEVQNNLEAKDLGKSMFSPIFFRYQIGDMTSSEVMNQFYPQLDNALARMNSEDKSLILRVGTSFTYFIKNNGRRVLMDNQLGIFNILRNKYEDDDVLIDVLRASNFKYLIIDLNTPFIDKTPEGSLRKKFKLLRRFLRGNEYLRLLCTNRIISERNSMTGQVVYKYKMFPEPDTDSKVYYGGQYAIYEIK